MTEHEARGHMLNEFYGRIGNQARDIKPCKIMMRSSGGGYRHCVELAEAQLFGIPGSELWEYGLELQLPKRLGTSNFTREELRELARECKDYAEKIARQGYPLTASYVREVALYYLKAAHKTKPA